jgi:pimeloyl-ACP methyl ester carboxylesterase
VVRFRVQHYQAYATRLRANVLAPDYRGFGDSTGTPSEAGLTVDARASWDWLRAHCASPGNVLIVGSSLGTGVAVQFASSLEDEVTRSRAKKEARIVNPRVGSRHMRIGGHNGTWTRRSVAVQERPRGVVLLSPFSKLETLLDSYYILNLVPLFVPLKAIPYLSRKSPILCFPMRHRNTKKGTEMMWACDETDLVKRFIIHRFDSLAKVVVSPVFQSSVDIFQKRTDRTSCPSMAASFPSA